jgi:hypothetical protein
MEPSELKRPTIAFTLVRTPQVIERSIVSRCSRVTNTESAKFAQLLKEVKKARPCKDNPPIVGEDIELMTTSAKTRSTQ